jgi:hypothetical protein
MAYCVDKYDLYSKAFRYINVENSNWFKRLTEGSLTRYRNKDRLTIEFPHYQQAAECQKKAGAMNISNVLYLTGSQEHGRIDIMMNWSKDIPRRLKPREELKLDLEV